MGDPAVVIAGPWPERPSDFVQRGPVSETNHEERIGKLEALGVRLGFAVLVAAGLGASLGHDAVNGIVPAVRAIFGV